MNLSKGFISELIELIKDIETNLPNKRHKPAPKRYEKICKGMYYATFEKNRKTQWYAFFTKQLKINEIIYIVRYIGNNHTDAHHLV